MSGEICSKSRSYFFEWKIRKFQTAKKRKEYKSYTSPQFKLRDATWNLNICVNASSRVFMDVSVTKHGNFDINHDVFYELTVKSDDGKAYATTKGKCEFRGRDVIHYIPTLLYHTNELEHEWKNASLTIYCKVKCDLDPQLPEMTEACKIYPATFPGGNSAEEQEDKVATDPRTSGFMKRRKDFKKMFLSGRDSDVTLVVRGRKFSVHKGILGARSPEFASMFEQEVKEDIVKITDIDAGAFYNFLLYLYAAETYLTLNNVLELYQIANKYRVLDLKEVAVEFMKNNLTVDIFCDVFREILLHEECKLLRPMVKIFKRNVREILETTKWKSYLKENPLIVNEFLIKASDIWIS